MTFRGGREVTEVFPWNLNTWEAHCSRRKSDQRSGPHQSFSKVVIYIYIYIFQIDFTKTEDVVPFCSVPAPFRSHLFVLRFFKVFCNFTGEGKTQIENSKICLSYNEDVCLWTSQKCIYVDIMWIIMCRARQSMFLRIRKIKLKLLFIENKYFV